MYSGDCRRNQAARAGFCKSLNNIFYLCIISLEIFGLWIDCKFSLQDFQSNLHDFERYIA